MMEGCRSVRREREGRERGEKEKKGGLGREQGEGGRERLLEVRNWVLYRALISRILRGGEQG